MNKISDKDLQEKEFEEELKHNFILRSLDHPDKYYLRVPNTRLTMHCSKSLPFYSALPTPAPLTSALTTTITLTHRHSSVYLKK